MARYDVTCDTCGADMIFHTFGGNSRDRQWRADHWTHECDECKMKRIKIENEKNAQKNREEGLPPLQGSEKQIAWAETIRAEFLGSVDALIEQVTEFYELYSKYLKEYEGKGVKRIASRAIRDVRMSFFDTSDRNFLIENSLEKINYKITKLFQNTSSSFWIDSRRCDFSSLLEDIKDEEIEIAESIKEQLQKDAEIEATVCPSEPKSETVAIIAIEKNTKITVAFDERRDDFRTLVKSHGFSWGTGRWYRNISITNGTVADRVAEIGNTLLSEGFIVRLFDEELRQKAIDGIYEPEHTRWIMKRSSGTYEGWFVISWKRFNEDFYEVARKLPTSKWSNPSVVVRPEQFEAVLDFANEYDFKLSKGALELVEEARRAKEAQLVPTVKKGADADEANIKDRDFENVSDDVDSDLVD